MTKRQDADIHGVLLIDKGQGMTSHDVVAMARRALGTKKIGHCGTLDPMATGLLMLVIGHATKLQDFLMCENKEYEGTITLGTTTSSQDAEGDILEQKPTTGITESAALSAFDQYLGDFEQIPPMVSAIKKDGVPLYKLARQGIDIERKARPISVYGYQIRAMRLPEVDFTVQCSKGFYVRSYAHDIGASLGCGAHLSALRRTRSGGFTLEKAFPALSLKTASLDEILPSLLSIEEILLLKQGEK